MQNITTERRPLGITIIAILLFIQAIFEIIVGIFSFFASIIHNPLAGLLVGWIPLILEIVNIVLHFLGYGQTHSILAIISGGIISIIIVIYLLVDRNVRRAFRVGF